MDLMDDEDLKKSVIDKMMGELDGITSDSLKKKPEMPAKGVEISIMVSPKGDEMPEDQDDDEMCDVEGCQDPAHNHGETESGDENYISDLMKKLG